MLFSNLLHHRTRHSGRRPHRSLRRRLLLEVLESRSLLNTAPPIASVLDPAQGDKITPADFKNPLSPIGTTSYSTDYNVNTDTPGGENANQPPHNETTIAVNPTNPLNLIGSANDYQVIVKNNGVFLVGFNRAHVTFDGGRTWTEYPVPFQGYNETSDPAVSFDADGTAYFSNLAYVSPPHLTGNGTTPDVVVSHSTDGGKTWSAAVRVAKGVGSVAPHSLEVFPDKEYIVAWGHGNAIVTWTQYRFGPTGVFVDAPIYAGVTHDGGNTWTDPVPIALSDIGDEHVVDQSSVPTVAVGPDGSVSIYVAFEKSPVSRVTDVDYHSARSHYMVVKVDPATSQPLSAPIEAGLVYDGPNDYPINVDDRETYQDSQFRTNAGGNITADPTDPQHLAVVWSDMRNNPYLDAVLLSLDPYQVQTNSDIIVSQSFDGGQNWSKPTAINALCDQFMPWGAYNSSGQLQIGYYDRSYDQANHLYGYTLASETTPGSLNFTFQQVTTTLSDPTQGDAYGFRVTANSNFPNATTFMGDYSGIAAVSTTLVATLWTDMRLQVNGFWAEDAFFALVDPPALGSSASSVSPSDFSPSRPTVDVSSRDAFFASANAWVSVLASDRAAFTLPAPTTHGGLLRAALLQPTAAMDQSGGQAAASSIRQLTLAGGADASDVIATDEGDADELALIVHAD
jgi:hypothetical protein